MLNSVTLFDDLAKKEDLNAIFTFHTIFKRRSLIHGTKLMSIQPS